MATATGTPTTAAEKTARDLSNIPKELADKFPSDGSGFSEADRVKAAETSKQAAETKSETKPETKSEAKSEAKSDTKPEWLTEDLAARAAAFKLPPEKLNEYSSADALQYTLDLLVENATAVSSPDTASKEPERLTAEEWAARQQQQQQQADTSNDALFKPFEPKINADDFGDDALAAEFKRLTEYTNSQMSKLSSVLQRYQDAEVQRKQADDARMEAEFDRLCDAAPSSLTPFLGKGTIHTLPKTSPEALHRMKLFPVFYRLRNSFAAQGIEMSDDAVWNEAARAVFKNLFQPTQSGNGKERPRNAGGRFIAGAGGSGAETEGTQTDADKERNEVLEKISRRTGIPI